MTKNQASHFEVLHFIFPGTNDEETLVHPRRARRDRGVENLGAVRLVKYLGLVPSLTTDVLNACQLCFVRAPSRGLLLHI